MIEEFKNRGRNSQFVDTRIGETSSRLTEDDKMKLRYMRVQKEELNKTVSAMKSGRKTAKFNLSDDEGDNDAFNFMTHKGKKIEELDDFKEQIDNSDGDEFDDRDLKKGVMSEEMVNSLNFGGGE